MLHEKYNDKTNKMVSYTEEVRLWIHGKKDECFKNFGTRSVDEILIKLTVFGSSDELNQLDIHLSGT